eukprot:TRINITY_DN770_c0_g1_i1.p1 TRINITY_DN770_c0_g1~~TRINITY_DN770_c0_g1_i1.p1  ORF type:complete len:1067 (-),score=487.40 TRINITY_DN770_c0_g1_i1:382-3582(-)
MSAAPSLKSSATRTMTSNRDLHGLRNRAPSSTDDHKPLEIIGSPPLGHRTMEQFVPHTWVYFEQDPLDSKTPNPCPPQFEQQMDEVKAILKEESLVNSDRLDHEVEWYYGGLGLDKHYFERNTAQEIAEHIGSLYSAKALAHMSGAGLELQLADRRKGKALFIVRSTPGSNRSPSSRVEQRIDADYLGEGYRHTGEVRPEGEKRFRVECYRTRGTVSPNNSIHLRLYLLTELNFRNPNAGPTDLDFDQIADQNFLANTDDARLDIYRDLVASAVNQLGPSIRVLDLNNDKFEKNLLIAYRSGTTHSFFSAVTHLYHSFQLYSTAKYVNHFANGITVFSFFLLPRKPENALTEQTKKQLIEEVNMIYILPRTSISDLFVQGHLTAKEYAYTYAAWKFAFHFLSRQSVEFATLSSAFKDDPNYAQMLNSIRTVVQREAYTEGRIMEPLFDYPDLIKDLYHNFERRFFRVGGGTLAEVGVGINDTSDDEALLAKVDRTVSSELDRQIFRKILQFNQHILKTNFYKTNKIALSFRLDPKFVSAREYPVTPFALFFVVGPEFRGFHLRFRDVARGGIRIIRSANFQAFLQNVTTVFDENYNLASTQERKNKDIAEGGSKGTILLSVDHQDKAQIAFSKYVDSLLDLLLPDPDIVDYYAQQELLFLGPDEGTAHYMDWASQHAKSRGYKFWKSFTTGKSMSLGGIPHDTFGMTTRSVHQYVLGTLEKLGLNESECTKFQTGGPDGDLGSNEIKISKDKTIGIVDGSGVLFDPNGLDKAELLRLAEARVMSENFDMSKLSARGFFVSIKDTDKTLPDGTVVAKGLDFRNAFHLNPMAGADVFVPCGGRPEAVNMSNVAMLLDEATKRPRFKYIIEGANLFFTQEARLYLEKKGVVMFKDASANKGGVTSSSLEVLTALAMSDAEFEEHMMVKDGVIPKFYTTYIGDVHQKIEENAQIEFQAIWNEHERTGTPRAVLSDQISNKINELSKAIETSDLWLNTELRRKVLAETCPRSLTNLLGLDKVLERVPENYLRAMFGCFLASRYVYKCGLAQIPEFAFYKFMGTYTAQLLSQ